MELENGSSGNFELVGHGRVTNEMCGRFSGYYVCFNVDGHREMRLRSHEADAGGERVVYVKTHHSCNNPRCPVCFKHGWASREATAIEHRLREAGKHFGGGLRSKDNSFGCEHLSVMLPFKYWHGIFDHKRFLVARKAAKKALVARGIVGGCLIFHGYKYADEGEAYERRVESGWRWSPHFHCLGFIIDGYAKCRKCWNEHKGCKIPNCKRFVRRSLNLFESDGFVVKVAVSRKTLKQDKRDTVGTAWYQLNHSAVERDKERFQVVSWFGNCSYCKLKVTKEKRVKLCPVCKDREMVRASFFGSERLEDEKGFSFLSEDGREVWEQKVGCHGYG